MAERPVGPDELSSGDGLCSAMTVTRAFRTPVRLGPYVWGRQIGRGGMAHVHLARRARQGDFTEYAAKRILPKYSGQRRYARMFCEEAALGFLLRHPNIVRTVDFGMQDDELVLILEYVEGMSCRHLLQLGAGLGEPFPVDAALYVAGEVLKGLGYAHEARGPTGRRLGVVHRDVSPGNVLLSTLGEVKLTDFGVARQIDGPHDTHPGVLKGKCAYMSPEQIEGIALDHRSDLFSVAVVLFEMLVGKQLFTGKSEFEVLTRAHGADLSALAEASAKIPLELQLILATALAKEPRDRFQSANEFLVALEDFATHARLSPQTDALTAWYSRVVGVPDRSGTFPVPRDPDDDRISGTPTEVSALPQEPLRRRWHGG
jgi:eukaryotic-like serine/threonine-protein kinase